MSDTPRTDAARGYFDIDTAVSADVAEQLERENNQLRAALAEIAGASHFDNVGGWARNRARAVLAKTKIT
jgi:hypothetical protein